MAEQKENTKHPKIIELEPMGYGNPAAPISYQKNIENGSLPRVVDKGALEHLKNAQDVLVQVQHPDDGCIDGRETALLYVYGEDGSMRLVPIDNANHERAKVAGGGYITTLAMRLGVGIRGVSPDADLAAIGTDLAEKGLVCGAHSGEHQHGDDTDCKANDKLSIILKNGLLFQDKLKETAKGLLGSIGIAFKEALFEQVMANWQAVLSDVSYFSESTGASRLNTILETQVTVNEEARHKQAHSQEKAVAVTKYLEGDHHEAYIVINFVKGTTVSQNALRGILRKDFPGEEESKLPQAFVVDAWRVAQLAEAAAEDDEAREVALYAGVLFQLATVATLTDGSLKTVVYTEE